jgi:hypothetical protein
MKKLEKRLASDLLREAAERYGNDSCTDYEWPEWFPREDRVALMEDDSEEAIEQTQIHHVMELLADELAAESK